MSPTQIALLVISIALLATSMYAGFRTVQAFRNPIRRYRHAGTGLLTLGAAIMTSGTAYNPKGGLWTLTDRIAVPIVVVGLVLYIVSVVLGAKKLSRKQRQAQHPEEPSD